PPDLPVGYHALHPDDGGPVTRLFVTPGRCHLPPDLRAWLPVVQLPSCRSAESWGIGDLADLRAIANWAAGRGAGMVAVSPLHAPLPLDRVEPSPYRPPSRRWRTPLLPRIAEVPGAAADPDPRGPHPRPGRAEPLPPVEPAVAQPAAAAHRGGPRRRGRPRRRRAGRPGPAAEPGPGRRPRRGVGAEAPGARAAVGTPRAGPPLR